MTDEQKKLLAVFESRVRQLMFMYDAVKQENVGLKEQLSAKEQELAVALEEIENCNVKYNNLKVARIIAVKQDDLSGAKKRLSKLVREVDKCIALLNE